MRVPPAALKGNSVVSVRCLGLFCIVMTTIALGTAVPSLLSGQHLQFSPSSMHGVQESLIDIGSVVERKVTTLFKRGKNSIEIAYQSIFNSSKGSKQETEFLTNFSANPGINFDPKTVSPLPPFNFDGIRLPSNEAKIAVERDTLVIAPVYFNRHAPSHGARVGIVARGSGESKQLTVLVEDGVILSSIGRAAVLRVKPYEALLLRELKDIASFEFVSILEGGQSPLEGQRTQSLENARAILSK